MPKMARILRKMLKNALKKEKFFDKIIKIKFTRENIWIKILEIFF